MEKMKDRLNKLRKLLNITQLEFAKKLKLSHGQVSAMETGRSAINEQNIALICTPNRLQEGKTVNEAWLRTGKGDMFIDPVPADGRPRLFDENRAEIPPDEEEIVGIYRQLTKPNKTVAKRQIDVLLEGQEGK